MYPQIKLLGYEIGTFPVCVGIGLAFGTAFIFLQLKRMAVSPERENAVMPAIPFTFIVGAVGAHIVDVILIGGVKALIKTPFAYGLTFYGWLFTACIFLLIYSRAVHISPAFMLNLFCPAFAAAQAWGRLGCFLGGCCYGQPSSWGVVYPVGSLPYTHFGATPLLPVQLFECIYLAVLFIVLIVFIRFKRRAVWYFILAPIGRFVLEFFRSDERGVLFKETLSPSQWFSIVFFVVGICWFLSIKKQGEKYVSRKQ